MRSATIILTALAMLVFRSNPADAGCGCSKPPPALAQVRPAVAYAGARVTFFSPAFVAGQLYNVTFQSGTTPASAIVQGQVTVRRDLGDGLYKPQLTVALPVLPLGPAAITVTAVGQTAPLIALNDAAFTVAPTPMALPVTRGAWVYPGFQAAVGRDGVVYLALDLTGLTEPMVFEAQAVGYPLRFTPADVVFKNIQGFLMQLLVQQTSPSPVPGMFVYPATNMTTDSDKLHYSRHEFNTYFLQHAERQPHAVDPTDGDWHIDGTPHIDHDHLILAISGRMNNGALPTPGATPAFNLTMTTYSLFYQGIVGASSVTLSGSAKTDSFDSNTMQPGTNGDVFTKGVLTVSNQAIIFGDATASMVKVQGQADITGAWQKKGDGIDAAFMTAAVPAGIPSLGAISLNGTSQTINGPGSFAVSSITLTSTSTLFIDNTNGPVTLYVTGKVTVLDGSVIKVADPKPEKLAIYVIGTNPVNLSGKGKLEGVVYAPSSTVTIGGDAEFRGAVVGDVLNMSSTSDFHYDSTLRGK